MTTLFFGYINTDTSILNSKQSIPYGQQNDYFYDRHIIGWTREAYGLACIMTNQNGGQLYMYVGQQYQNQIFLFQYNELQMHQILQLGNFY